MTKKISGSIAKWMLITLSTVVVMLSAILTSSALDPAQAWAQCGADSYVDCSGGVRCTSTDDKGCACYDSRGRVVDKHSCSEAAPELLMEVSAY